ncbi:hypothetical protein P43SY_005728 [Pythium insidiosum]|uniref:Uncharacterized protein n=1 Tax=Pythium insidiosum TaxID=114742 RepID=A0AAD5MBM7_PYTIN|nr:hypothetical protein P43SY_005728 [Pythium insidiosum]
MSPRRRRRSRGDTERSPVKRRTRALSVASDAARVARPLDQLSMAMWERILRFAVDRPVDAISPRPPRRPDALLAPLQGITCQADACCRKLARQAAKSRVTLRVASAKSVSRRDVDAIRAAPDDVRALALARLDAEDHAVRASWLQLFASMPGLRRLDLGACRWSDPWLRPVLEAASVKCPLVESLVLPGCDSPAQAYDSEDDDGELNEERQGTRRRAAAAGEARDGYLLCERKDLGTAGAPSIAAAPEEDSTSDTSDDDEEEEEDDSSNAEEDDDCETAADHAEDLLPVVYEALERWFERGGIGGLRQVRMASRPQDRSLKQNSLFLKAIARWCPGIQYLDGWKGSFRMAYRHRVHCLDSMNVPIDVWTSFCDTCVHLREFNWVVVPFNDAFIRAFVRSPKRDLCKLRVEFRARPDEFPVMAGYQFFATSLPLLLSGVPALEHLVIRGSSAFLMQDMISDKLLLALARRCPRLRKLRLLGNRRAAYTNVTDLGVMALARLPLQYLWFDYYVCCSKWSVLALIEQHATASRVQRTVYLPVSSSEVIVDVLTSLESSPPGHYASARFVLETPLEHGEELPSDWLTRTRFALEQRHPTLRLQLTMEKRASEATVWVSKFTFPSVESPQNLPEMSDEDFVTYVKEVIAPMRRSTKHLRSIATWTSSFEDSSNFRGADYSPPFLAYLDMQPTIDAVTAQEVVRIAVARLDMMIPGLADSVKSCTGVAWHADLWLRDSVLHFRCSRTYPITNMADPTLKLWHIMTSPHDYMTCHPAVKQYQVLRQINKNVIVTQSVEMVGPSHEVVMKMSVAFRVIVNGKCTVGSTTLPYNSSMAYPANGPIHSEVKGWVFDADDGLMAYWPSFRGCRVLGPVYEDVELLNEMATVVLADALRWETKTFHPIG